MVSFSHSFAVKLFQNSNNIQMEKRPWMGHFYIRCIRSKLLYNLKSNFESKRVFCKYLIARANYQDVRKRSPFFQRVAKKAFHLKSDFLQNSSKSFLIFGLLLKKVCCKKLAYLVTAFPSKIVSNIDCEQCDQIGLFYSLCNKFSILKEVQQFCQLLYCFEKLHI